MIKRPGRNHGPAFRVRVALEVIKREQVSIRMGLTVFRWILILVATMVVGLTAITIIGCGSSDTPSQVVEKFYKSTQENDCQKVVDLVSDASPESDSYVNDCKNYADRLVSYSITGETIYEGGHIARVDTDVTIKGDGGEKTNSAPQILVKRGDDWKLTRTESRD